MLLLIIDHGHCARARLNPQVYKLVTSPLPKGEDRVRKGVKWDTAGKPLTSILSPE
jgi:hypothetical protein